MKNILDTKVNIINTLWALRLLELKVYISVRKI